MTDVVARRHRDQLTPLTPETQWEPAPESHEDPKLHQLLGTLRRNVWLIVGCVALAVGASSWVTSRLPRVYQASASIQVNRTQPGRVGLDNLQSLAAENDINTEMEVLSSRSLAAQVVDSLGLQLRVVKPAQPSQRALLSAVRVDTAAAAASYTLRRRPDGRFTIMPRDGGAPLGEAVVGQPVELPGATIVLTPLAAEQPEIDIDVRLRDDAVNAVHRTVTVERPNRSAAIVVVHYEHTDPALARDVVNALTTGFLARRQRVQQTETRSTVTFLRDQIENLSAQLASAENALRTFREGQRVVDLEAEARARVGREAQLQAQRTDLESERQALAQLMEEVRTEAARRQPGDPSPYRNLLAFPTLLRSQAASDLLSTLSSVEERRAELLNRRSERDPDVQRLSERSAQLELQLRSVAETYLKGLTNQTSALDAALAQSQQQLERFPARDIEFARLKRQATVLAEIHTLLLTRLKEAEISEAVEDASVRLIDAATLPRVPVRPDPVMNMIFAIAAGLLVGVTASLARDSMDTSVRTRKDVLVAGLPVLGMVPRSRRRGLAHGRNGSPISKWLPGRGGAHAAGNGGRGLPAGGAAAGTDVVEVNSDRSLVEAYIRLRTNIAFAHPGRPLKTVVFTSPLPGEGKTTTAANVALTLARRGDRVLLVDADLRRGAVHRLFKAPREPGLSTVLTGACTVQAALRGVMVGEGGRLDFLTCGPFPADPAHLLASPQMQTLLGEMQLHYDTIIIDSPPLNVVSDAAVLGARADGVIVVARAGVTAHKALMYTIEQLRSVHAPVLGAVLNAVDVDRDAGYYGAYDADYGRENSRYAASPG
jgi:polysaccharide biosynthesis transport protein